MPRKITRRPFEECSYSFYLDHLGENVDTLHHRPCKSSDSVIVWENECNHLSGNEMSGECTFSICSEQISTRQRQIPWGKPSFEYFDNATMYESQYDIPDGLDAGHFDAKSFPWYLSNFVDDHLCQYHASAAVTIVAVDPLAVSFPPPVLAEDGSGHYLHWHEHTSGLFSSILYLLATFDMNGVLTILAYVHTDSVFDPISGVDPNSIYTVARYTHDAVECSGLLKLIRDNDAGFASLVFSGTSTVYISNEESDYRPDYNDRIRSKHLLEYDIENQKWILRTTGAGFCHVWSLADSEPCVGGEKTLDIETLPSNTSISCVSEPLQVTLKRVCPPSGVAPARRQRQSSHQMANHKFHLCGCDCQDQVTDLRGDCESKCVNNSTRGCETYPEDKVKCLYPISADCCSYCRSASIDPPCAYEALFDCDISHGGSQIAAKVVTLRHKCYFENECTWVALGAEQNGFVGKEPICADCRDDCQSGCTWASWKTGPCKTDTDTCEPQLPVSKTKCLEFRWHDTTVYPVFAVGDVAAVLSLASETITDGVVHWVFTSADGQWVASVYPNTTMTNDPSQPTSLYCGRATLLWNGAPPDFTTDTSWTSQNIYNVCPALVSCGLHNPDVIVSKGTNPLANTLLKMNWIDC